MRLERHLLEISESIECEGCGICCPRDCEFLNGKLCKIHPTIIGEERRPIVCPIATPGMIVAGFKIFCPPVMRIIHDLTGVEVRRQSESRMCDQGQLDKVLQMEISC